MFLPRHTRFRAAIGPQRPVESGHLRQPFEQRQQAVVWECTRRAGELLRQRDLCDYDPWMRLAGTPGTIGAHATWTISRRIPLPLIHRSRYPVII